MPLYGNHNKCFNAAPMREKHITNKQYNRMIMVQGWELCTWNIYVLIYIYIIEV